MISVKQILPVCMTFCFFQGAVLAHAAELPFSNAVLILLQILFIHTAINFLIVSTHLCIRCLQLALHCPQPACLPLLPVLSSWQVALGNFPAPTALQVSSGSLPGHLMFTQKLLCYSVLNLFQSQFICCFPFWTLVKPCFEGFALVVACCLFCFFFKSLCPLAFLGFTLPLIWGAGISSLFFPHRHSLVQKQHQFLKVLTSYSYLPHDQNSENTDS